MNITEFLAQGHDEIKRQTTLDTLNTARHDLAELFETLGDLRDGGDRETIAMANRLRGLTESFFQIIDADIDRLNH